MHAVDRLARALVPAQRLQHQSVAAERHHDVGLVGILIAVELDELRQRGLRLGACARDKGDPVVSLGGGHRTTNSRVAAGWVGAGLRRARLYTLLGLVEINPRDFSAPRRTRTTAGPQSPD